MFKNVIRLAVIEKVDQSSQTVSIRMIDRAEPRLYKVPINHPAAMNSSGVFVAPTAGTRVLVSATYSEAPVILSYFPNEAFAKDLNRSINTDSFLTTDTEYPKLKPGEVSLQGPLRSKLLFDQKGQVKVEFGNSTIYHTDNDIYAYNVRQHYENTSASRTIKGEVFRDVRKQARSIENVFDKLYSPKYDSLLSKIGRNPVLASTNISNSTGGTEVLRNPALVEERNIVYEFALESNIGSFQEESERLTNSEAFPLIDNSARSRTRTDVLNLNPFTPNSLMEEVKGTVVDIYGNILDLNRSVINYTSIDPKSPQRLELEDKLLRRSIKYHFEINSKKAPTADASFRGGSFKVDALDTNLEKTGYSHSRWSVDVDGEGLTKLNIPASTNTGNIPLLTRYSNANVRRDNFSSTFRDEESPTLDVLHLAFGENSSNGISLTDDYSPSNFGDRFSQEKVVYRTAYHDIVNTAKDVLNDQAVSDSVSNSLDGFADAGGRSLHANLDGSLELNVGRDVVDGKSIVADLAGGIVSRVGKTITQHSIISQLDGNINIQVGGDSIETDNPVTAPSVKFFVANGDNYHEIEVSSEGIFFRSAPNTSIVLDSSRNLVLKSQGDTLLHGENVFIHGTADDSGNSIAGERLVMRSGRKVF